MEKIDIAELLKDCPEGMKLDCLMYDYVSLIQVSDGNAYPIKIKTPDGQVSLTKYGSYSLNKHAKCIIFPKGKTTWEGFILPCNFKDGDVVVTGNKYKCVAIFKSAKSFYDNKGFNYYVLIPLYIKEATLRTDDWIDGVDTRLATEEEKEKLFKTIKENGYKWNSVTKTLVKLIQPRFKVGDKVRHKNNHNVVFTITSIDIEEDSYGCGIAKVFWFDNQDDYELVPDKFDITTLKPFESRVLVRNENNRTWRPAVFGCYIKNHYDSFYVLDGNSWRHCIPYEGNEHLRGTTNDCDEYYKNW